MTPTERALLTGVVERLQNAAARERAPNGEPQYTRRTLIVPAAEWELWQQIARNGAEDPHVPTASVSALVRYCVARVLTDTVVAPPAGTPEPKTA